MGQLTKNELRRIGSDFGKALAAELAHRNSRTYSNGVVRLRRLENDYCKRLSAHPQFARELKRRVAETLFQMTIGRASKMPACRERFKSLSKLGFSDIESKGHFHLIYARAALARGHRGIARKTANQMANELSRSLADENSLLGREILGHLSGLLRKL